MRSLFARILNAGLLLSALASAAGATAIYPQEKLHPGQKGYGLTVFSDFKIERFNVEVIGVLQNFLAHQDVVLMRSDHPRLAQTGLVAGMSGSPVYIDGKLVGALAYGWSFSKDPVFGVTLIEDMLPLLSQKTRRTSNRAALTSPPPARSAQSSDQKPRLKPLAIPLSIAGVAPRARASLQQALEPYGIVPMQAGGSAQQLEGPDRLYPGASLALVMTSGDVAINAVGTVTLVRNNQVLAFGHPLYNSGELFLPATTARVHHNLASLSTSFRIASPAREVGALLQDRQQGILVGLNERAQLIPMTVQIDDGVRQQTTRVRLARHHRLTGMLARTVLASAIEAGYADVEDITFSVRTKLTLRKHGELQVVDAHYSSEGLLSPSLALSRGLVALQSLIENRFSQVTVERIRVEVALQYEANVATIESVAVPHNRVVAGQRLPVVVTLRPRRGRRFRRTVEVEVPQTLRGSLVELEVSSGQSVSPTVAPPQNVSQLIAQLQAQYPPRSLVVGLHVPKHGLTLNGEVLEDLPPSVFDALGAASKARKSSTIKPIYRSVFDSKQLLQGSFRLKLRVKPEVDS